MMRPRLAGPGGAGRPPVARKRQKLGISATKIKKSAAHEKKQLIFLFDPNPSPFPPFVFYFLFFFFFFVSKSPDVVFGGIPARHLGPPGSFFFSQKFKFI